MSTTLPYENLTWIQNGEPVSGGVSGGSQGVLNRPLLELTANVDAVRDAHDVLNAEVVAARDGETSLAVKIQSIDDLIAALGTSATAMNSESVAKINRDKFPSGFNIDVLKESLELQEVSAASAMGSGTNIPRNLITSGLGFPRTAGISTADSNKAFYMGSPKPLFAHGHPLKLEARPEYGASLVITHPTAPSTGTRQEMVFVEMWKEEIKLGVADSVAFPYGNVNFENTKTGTYDTCTLLNTNATGGNYPAYLAASGTHGFYVKTDDVNFIEFAKNPENNVIIDGDKVYQMLFRVRVVTATPTSRHPWMDTTIKAQGKLAAASAFAFNPNADDVGESFASDASLASDGKVYAYPLYIAHRRNSTVWSYANPNGAGSISSGVSGRPDGKFYDQISIDDVLDLRCHISLNNQHDVKDIYERTLNKILSCNLMTSWENLNSDSDGNETYKALNIHATKLLRAEGVCGTDTFDASDEVIWAKKASNGISTEFDGFRSYFSDIGGDQTVTGLIPNVGVDGVNPTNIFTYVASSRTLTIDATDLKSNAGLAQSARTKVSVREPHLVWSGKSAYVPSASSAPKVAGTWSGLGGDSASFVADNITHAVATRQGYAVAAYPLPTAGAIYTSPDGVTCTVVQGIGDGTGTMYALGYSFSGSTMPVFTGADVVWTKVSGTGPASLTLSSQTAPGYKHLYTVVGAPSYGYTGTYIGEGSNLHSGHGIHVNAYITFQPGSGFIARVPYQNEQSIKATHYKVQVGGVPTQILPNNGVGFIPFGNTVDPVNDGNVAQDTHTKSTSMTGFVYKDPVMGGNNPKMPNWTESDMPCVIKESPTSYKMWWHGYTGPIAKYTMMYSTSTDGIAWSAPLDISADFIHPDISNAGFPNVVFHNNVYKMWFTGLVGSAWSIFFSESSDGVNWSTPTKAISHDSVSSCCVMIVGDTYKMWYSNYVSSKVKIYYTTSSNGLNWASPTLAMDIGNEPTGYNSVYSMIPQVILDGSTYKMWFTGSNGVNYRILYSTSSDGITWATPSLALNIGTAPNSYDVKNVSRGRVLLDGSTYKMWYVGINNYNIARILYTTSSTGYSGWTTPVLSQDVSGETNGYQSQNSNSPSVIKDGSTYKMWFCGHDGVADRILYATSSDCITWSTPVLVMDIGASPESANGAYTPCVIKDGSTYKMWFTGSDGTYRILYSTSSNGTTWTTPVLVMDIGASPESANGAYAPCVIKDGSTYKMWFSGCTGATYRILYSTSANGTTWNIPVLAVNINSNPLGYDTSAVYTPSVIKEGSIYRMVYSSFISGSGNYLFSRISYDGISWSSPTLLVYTNTVPNGFNATYSALPCLIKDGPSYRLWWCGSPGGASNPYKIFYATLALTDASNVGSSTTGVYTTQGPINCCPPADSQAVMFYEANANDVATELNNKSDTFAHVYSNNKYWITSLGTGAYFVGNGLNRDFAAYSVGKYGDGFSAFYLKCDNLSSGNTNEFDVSGHYQNSWASDAYSKSTFVSTSPLSYVDPIRQISTAIIAPILSNAYMSAGSQVYHNTAPLSGLDLAWTYMKIPSTAGTNPEAYRELMMKASLISLNSHKKYAVYCNFGWRYTSTGNMYGKVLLPLGRPIVK